MPRLGPSAGVLCLRHPWHVLVSGKWDSAPLPSAQRYTEELTSRRRPVAACEVKSGAALSRVHYRLLTSILVRCFDEWLYILKRFSNFPLSSHHVPTFLSFFLKMWCKLRSRWSLRELVKPDAVSITLTFSYFQLSTCPQLYMYIYVCVCKKINYCAPSGYYLPSHLPLGAVFWLVPISESIVHVFYSTQWLPGSFWWTLRFLWRLHFQFL